MIVNRRTFVAKKGCLEEAAALMRAEVERTALPNTQRICIPVVAPFDLLVYEAEYENLEEYERLWTEWGASPEAAVFMEKWNALTEIGGTNEIWELV